MFTKTLCAAVVALGFTAAVSAAPITYLVNHAIGNGSVVGSITTDGALGVLSVGNITGWSFTLSSPNLVGGPTEVIFGTSASATVIGSALIATSGDLTFDYGVVNAAFAFQGQSGNAWCGVSSGYNCSGESTPSDGIFFGVTNAWAELAHPTGVMLMGQAQGTVPEPASLALVGLALAGLALGRRRAA